MQVVKPDDKHHGKTGLVEEISGDDVWIAFSSAGLHSYCFTPNELKVIRASAVKTSTAVKTAAITKNPRVTEQLQSRGPHGGYTPEAPSGLVRIGGLGEVPLASIGRRLAARSIDFLFIVVVLVVLRLIAGAFHYMSSGIGSTLFVLTTILALAFILLYEWLFVAFLGATVGKMAVGIKVVDQFTGAVIGIGPAFVRQVIPFVGALILLVGALLVYLSPLFDSSGRMQGWHDKAARDLVIAVR
ncbi:RDD family protein [Mycolicibacterium sp. GF69]|uniref:RDD family protein n=1 Tax=Mycolicibacterium sp. GF69 TaxID=2267251 RepID=UPI00197BE3D3|nr:RDD family protein [Mycolicibacterium sp. GF69]